MGEFWQTHNQMKRYFSCCAAPNYPLRIYGCPAAGCTTALTLNTRKYYKWCTWAHTTENVLTQTMKGCLVKYIKKKWNGGLLCGWPARINRTGSPGWISELTSLYLWEVKENTAVVAISPLTLFLICLQAMICFTDVARAPPPPLLWPNV